MADTEAKAETETEAVESYVHRIASDVENNIARLRQILEEDVPALGAVFDKTLPQRESETGSAFDQRRVDTLISAAFVLFSNTRLEGKSVPAFVSYVQGIVTVAMFALGYALPSASPDSRIRELSQLLAENLLFGEDFALVLFSAEHIAWNTSLSGPLGLEYFELAAKGVRLSLNNELIVRSATKADEAAKTDEATETAKAHAPKTAE